MVYNTYNYCIDRLTIAYTMLSLLHPRYYSARFDDGYHQEDIKGKQGLVSLTE